jgi:hypothetical protein
MNERETEIRRVIRTLWVLWAAFLSAPVLYMAVGYLITRERGPALAAPGASGLLKPIFYAFGGVMLLGAFLLRRQLMGRAHREPYAAMMGLQAAMVTGWAMTEVVAILGLALVLLGRPLADAVPFVAVALAAIALQRPDADGVRRLLESTY